MKLTRTLVLSAAFLGALSLSLSPSRSDAAVDPNLVIGVCTHLGQGKHYSGTEVVKLVKQGGFRSIRDEIYWSQVERRKGDLKMPQTVLADLKQAKKANIDVLLVLGYGSDAYGPRKKPFTPEVMEGYKRYVDFVTREMGNDAWGYEIWNEWDWKSGGYNTGDAASYMEVVKAVAPIVRKNCPKCVLIGGGVTYKGMHKNWHLDVLKLGLLDHVDGISLHPYVETFSKPDNIPAGLARWMDKIQADSQKVVGRQVPTYITEVGWSEVNGYSKNEIADFVDQTLDLLAKRNYIRGVWWYELQDGGTNKRDGEHAYGLVDYYGNAKNSFKRFLKKTQPASPASN